VATASVASPGLQLRLGIAFALAVSVGNVIGSGIMRTPGLVADQVPVVWMVLGLWALGGVHVLLSANVASELVGAIPKAGGAYVPVRAAFGDFAGLIAGWTDWLSNVAAIAALSVACANFLGIIFPTLVPRTSEVAAAFAMSVIIINWRGVREGRSHRRSEAWSRSP
jgi:APA family basic amino acid/polyamine antiporter